jgi:hypothetical protein
MTISPKAVATARRNLAQRIERCVGQISGDLQADDNVIANLREALNCLEQGMYPAGEDAMMNAEKGYPPRVPPTGPQKPIAELLAHFERVLKEG